MNASSTASEDQPEIVLSFARRLVVLGCVVIGSAAFIAATFTATAILPQMQGAFSASQDEIAWTVTFNILASAVVTPMTGWLVSRFGRRAVQFGCLTGFTLSTVACGLAQSLDILIAARIAQGAFGAPLIPLGQTIVLDVFPRRQHSVVISVLGIATTAGPVLGPGVGGYLSEHYGWEWGFFMVVPFAGLVAVVSRFALPEDNQARKSALDWVGFISLSVAIAATQLALSRGQQLDWFDSIEIILEVSLAALALYVFIIHSCTARSPYISPRLLLDRNFTIGAVLVGVFGMLNFLPMVLLPPMMQNQLGFPDSQVGFVVSARGAGVAAGFFAAMWTGRLDPRVGMVLGFGTQIICGLWLTAIDFNVSLSSLCINTFLQGLAVGLIWTPIVTTAFRTLDPALRPEGVGVFHLMRSIGTSFFVAISVAHVVRSSGANFSRLRENISPFNESFDFANLSGGWSAQTPEGLAALAFEINRQATLIGYVNAFALYTMVSLAAIPVVLIIGRTKR